MKKLLLIGLVFPLVLVVLALLLGFVVLVLSFSPAPVSVAAVCVLIVGAVWFFFARGRSAGGPASEYSLLGRAGSKDGLL